MKTFVLLGAGFCSNIVVSAYRKNLLPGYRLLGALSRKQEDVSKMLEGIDAVACKDADELLSLHPDYLLEAAGIPAFREICIRALEQGTSVMPLSIGSFADPDFYEAAMNAAKNNGTKIHIPSGAVGGFDVLQTVSLMAEAGVTHENPYGSDSPAAVTAGIHTHKGPKSLQNTPLFAEHLMTDSDETTVFSGTTKEAIALLPTKVNVAVASALASVGPAAATAAITSVPDFVGDDHCIKAKTNGIDVSVDIYSSTSAIAGWSLVAALRNLESPMQFF